jgi:MFS family permease
MSDRRSNLIVAVLALAGTTFALLQSVVVPALPDIERALGAGSAAGTWVLTANLLATAALTPVLGRLGDMYGKDRVLTSVMVVLGAGTLVCALASSLPVMLAGRALQGAGGAVFPLAFGVVRDELPRERIAGAVGLVSSLLGIGAGLGLVLSGPIVTALGWRWLFWLPLAVLVLSTALAHRFVPASPVRTPAAINVTSAALMVAGLSTLLVGVTEAGSWGWASPRTGGLLAAGAGLVAAWVRRELVSDSPLVDMRMMAVRGVWTTNVAAFLLGFGMYASIAVIPALVELPRSTGFGFGGSITAAGLFMLPTAFPQLIVGPLAGRIERRIGSRAQLLAGIVLMLAGYAALAMAHATAPELVADAAALGIGLGLGLAALAHLIVAAVSQAQTGVATAMNTVMRTLGGAFGAQVAASLIASSHGASGLPGDAGFTLAFAACAIALAGGFVAALAIPGRRRSRPAATLRACPVIKGPVSTNLRLQPLNHGSNEAGSHRQPWGSGGESAWRQCATVGPRDAAQTGGGVR